MRETIIIILIVVLIITGDVIVQWHLEKTSTNMASKLEELKKTVIESKENENNDKENKLKNNNRRSG